MGNSAFVVQTHRDVLAELRDLKAAARLSKMAIFPLKKVHCRPLSFKRTLLSYYQCTLDHARYSLLNYSQISPEQCAIKALTLRKNG